MPRLILTPGAQRGLARCQRLLAEKSPPAAQRAAHVISEALMRLETLPEIGRPALDRPGHRELLIEFGDAGYVALYRHDPAKKRVFVLAVRHQKETGY